MNDTLYYADKFISEIIKSNRLQQEDNSYNNDSSIENKEDHVLFVTQAIGLEKNQIDIDVTNNLLTVKSSSKSNSHKMTSLINEKLRLGEMIDKKNLSANLNKGILEIKLPYKKSFNKSRKIEIS